MSLIKCSECGKKISDKADVCINCGAPIELNDKKIDDKVNDERLDYLRNYLKRDKQILKVVLVIIVIVGIGAVMQKVSDKQKERTEYLESEKRWMEKSKGYYSNGWYSIDMDGNGGAKLCAGAGVTSIAGTSMSDGCTYPKYSYEYPNGYRFSGDNNFVTSCFVTCSMWENNPDLLLGFSCTKNNGETMWIPKKDFTRFIKCDEE